MFNLKTATNLGNYDSRFFKGKPVLSKNQVGKGTVYYVGSVVEDKVASTVMCDAIKRAAISPVAVSDNELMEVTEVAGSNGKYVYAINFSNEPQTIRLQKNMTDVLTKEKLTTSAVVQAMDYRLLKIE